MSIINSTVYHNKKRNSNNMNPDYNDEKRNDNDKNHYKRNEI